MSNPANIDFGLVPLALPKDSPLLIFAAGRTAGWIGQIIEEYQRKQLIRPRAHYTGARPLRGAFQIRGKTCRGRSGPILSFEVLVDRPRHVAPYPQLVIHPPLKS